MYMWLEDNEKEWQHIDIDLVRTWETHLPKVGADSSWYKLGLFATFWALKWISRFQWGITQCVFFGNPSLGRSSLASSPWMVWTLRKPHSEVSRTVWKKTWTSTLKTHILSENSIFHDSIIVLPLFASLRESKYWVCRISLCSLQPNKASSHGSTRSEPGAISRKQRDLNKGLVIGTCM